MSIDNNFNMDEIFCLPSDLVPQYLKPSMGVEYIFTPGLYHNGKIDNVPNDAIGAVIYQTLPYVAANGYITSYSISYSIYVGVCMDIERAFLAFTDECSQRDLNRLKEQNFKEIIIPANSRTPIEEFIGLCERDIVVASNKELEATIKRLKLIHKYMNYNISYPEQSVRFPNGGYRKRMFNK